MNVDPRSVGLFGNGRQVFETEPAEVLEGFESHPLPFGDVDAFPCFRVDAFFGRVNFRLEFPEVGDGDRVTFRRFV